MSRESETEPLTTEECLKLTRTAYTAEGTLMNCDPLTKQGLSSAVAEQRAELAKFKTEVLCWLVGAVGVSVLVNHFWR